MASTEANENNNTLLKTREKHLVSDAHRHEISEEFNKLEKRALQSLGGFRTFILRGNVVDLAIGIIIGAAFTAVVNAVVGDVITPLIPVPGHSLSSLTWHPPYAGVDAKGVPVVVDFGALINALISFFIVALVLYFFVVQPVNSLSKLYQPKLPPPPQSRECPFCLQDVNVKATRCAYCTSDLPPVPADPPATAVGD